MCRESIPTHDKYYSPLTIVLFVVQSQYHSFFMSTTEIWVIPPSSAAFLILRSPGFDKGIKPNKKVTEASPTLLPTGFEVAIPGLTDEQPTNIRKVAVKKIKKSLFIYLNLLLFRALV